MKKNILIFILLVLCCAAIFLRWNLLPSHLFFGPEQGRDMLVIRDIVVNHKLTLIGSKTDIAGVFHGPIFYYLSSIPFALTRGNPLAVSFFMILIQSMGVFFMYLLGRDLTKSRRVGLIAAALYALSFLPIVYGRWLSNPPLSLPFSLLFMWSCLQFLNGKKLYLILAAVSFACLGQAEFINFLLFACIGVAFSIRYWKKVKETPFFYIFIAFIAGLVLSFGNYALFDLRHEFLISKSVMGLMSGVSGYGVPLIDSMKNAFLMFASQFAMLFGVSSWLVGAIVFVLTLVILWRERRQHEYIDLVILWLVIPVATLMLLQHSVLEQLYVGLIPGMVLAVSIALDLLIRKVPVFGVVLGVGLCVLSLSSYIRYIPTNSYVFFQTPQPSVRYNDQIEVVDRIYRLANKKQFFFQAYTIPYFWQDAWTYLFWYQGTTKYGFIPKDEETSDVYVIIQKDRSDPIYQTNWYEKTVSTWGVRTEGFTIGEYTVEKRERDR